MFSSLSRYKTTNDGDLFSSGTLNKTTHSRTNDNRHVQGKLLQLSVVNHRRVSRAGDPRDPPLEPVRKKWQKGKHHYRPYYHFAENIYVGLKKNSKWDLRKEICKEYQALVWRLVKTKQNKTKSTTKNLSLAFVCTLVHIFHNSLYSLQQITGFFHNCNKTL